MRFAIVIMCALMHGCAAAHAPASREVDLSNQFSPAEGCFVMLDVRTGEMTRHNAERCTQRLSPCSTFKIPNSLIGLETGVIPDVDHVIKWDGRTNRRAAANRDHSLRSAFTESIVWYYQELATRAGRERMQAFVDAMSYGNRDLSGGLTTFWLGSSLVISAEKQVAFLDRLRRDELPLSERSMSTVRDLMIQSDHDGVILRGKTGSDGNGLGWFIGWVQCGDNVYVFAANATGDGVLGQVVREQILAILRQLGVLSGSEGS
jgi:beta-lactamase class D